MFKIFKMFLLFLICISIPKGFSIDYEEFINLSRSKPVSELDLKIERLNSLLNNKVKGLRAPIICTFNGGGWTNEGVFKSPVTLVNCSVVDSIIVCEIIIYRGCQYENIINRFKLVKFLYQKLSTLLKLNFFSNLENNHFKLIIKLSAIQKESSNYDEWIRFPNIYSLDLELSEISQPIEEEKTWVVWEKGIPYYQEDFFKFHQREWQMNNQLIYTLIISVNLLSSLAFSQENRLEEARENLINSHVEYAKLEIDRKCQKIKEKLRSLYREFYQYETTSQDGYSSSRYDKILKKIKKYEAKIENLKRTKQSIDEFDFNSGF